MSLTKQNNYIHIPAEVIANRAKYQRISIECRQNSDDSVLYGDINTPLPGTMDYNINPGDTPGESAARAIIAKILEIPGMAVPADPSGFGFGCDDNFNTLSSWMWKIDTANFPDQLCLMFDTDMNAESFPGIPKVPSVPNFTTFVRFFSYPEGVVPFKTQLEEFLEANNNEFNLLVGEYKPIE